MSDAGAEHPAKEAAPAPEAHDVFYLLSIFFAVTSTTSFLLYLAWSYLNRHQENITKKYHLDLTRYKLMNRSVPMSLTAGCVLCTKYQHGWRFCLSSARSP